MSTQHVHETGALWEDFRDRMLAYVQRRVASVEDAEDILQEVFLRIHTHAERLPEVENVAGWIYRIAANAVGDHFRKKTVDTRMLDLPDESGAAEEESSTSPGAMPGPVSSMVIESGRIWIVTEPSSV